MLFNANQYWWIFLKRHSLTVPVKCSRLVCNTLSRETALLHNKWQQEKVQLESCFLPMKPGFTNIEFKINSLKKKVKFHSFHTWISCHTPTIADNLLACLQIITFFNQHCEVSDIFYKTESAWIRRCTLTSKVSIEINDHKFRNSINFS